MSSTSLFASEPDDCGCQTGSSGCGAFCSIGALASLACTLFSAASAFDSGDGALTSVSCVPQLGQKLAPSKISPHWTQTFFPLIEKPPEAIKDTFIINAGATSQSLGQYYLG
jgi:hypothetical protein